MKKILHLDANHPILAEKLAAAGFINDFALTQSKAEVMDILPDYSGIIIRSRLPVDEALLSAGTQLEFIGRVGAGLENIDLAFAERQNIRCYNAPEGNRTAVAEHAMGMLLNLCNHLKRVDREVREGKWLRAENRGTEIEGKTIGLIGYGHMGKSFAQRLSGFDCEVLCYDIKAGVGDQYATQVTKKDLLAKSDVISLHTPQTPLTIGMIDAAFYEVCAKPITLINTARGSAIVTADLVKALHTGQVTAAGLDVLEYEKTSFESLFDQQQLPPALLELMQFSQVLLSPHIAGWTHESHYKLASTIAQKIIGDHA